MNCEAETGFAWCPDVMWVWEQQGSRVVIFQFALCGGIGPRTGSFLFFFFPFVFFLSVLLNSRWWVYTFTYLSGWWKHTFSRKEEMRQRWQDMDGKLMWEFEMFSNLRNRRVRNDLYTIFPQWTWSINLHFITWCQSGSEFLWAHWKGNTTQWQRCESAQWGHGSLR